MWEEKLKRIQERRKNTGREINGGASDEEIARLAQKMKEVFGFDLPKEYISIIKKINGLVHSGLNFYGVDEEFLETKPNQTIDGLLDNNEVWYENEWDDQEYLFIADDDMSWFVYDYRDKKYWELILGAGDKLNSFETMDEMFDAMLGNVLN